MSNFPLGDGGDALFIGGVLEHGFDIRRPGRVVVTSHLYPYPTRETWLSFASRPFQQAEYEPVPIEHAGGGISLYTTEILNLSSPSAYHQPSSLDN